MLVCSGRINAMPVESIDTASVEPVDTVPVEPVDVMSVEPDAVPVEPTSLAAPEVDGLTTRVAVLEERGEDADHDVLIAKYVMAAGVTDSGWRARWVNVAEVACADDEAIAEAWELSMWLLFKIMGDRHEKVLRGIKNQLET